MTTYVEARDELVTLINNKFSTDHPTLKVFYQNTKKVDTNTVGDQFVRVTVDMMKGKQSSIEFEPRRRVLGEVILEFVYKEGLGTRYSLEMYDYVESFLAMKTLTKVSTRVASPGADWEKEGWAGFRITVPFFFD